MPLNRIRKEDIEDLDIVDSSELISDGYGSNSIYLNVTCVSTTAPNTIVINLAADGNGIIESFDHPAQKDDIVWLTGTSGGAGDGYFNIDTILSDTSFTVTGTLANSTGGNVQFRNPSGASKVGFDPTGACIITHNTVQEALKDLDAAICSGDTGDQLTEIEHPTLRQLVHLADSCVGGPFEGFATGAYREVTGNKLAPNKVTWYASSAKIVKIVDRTVSYNGVLQPTTITWQAYKADGYTLNASVTDTVTYSGIFEVSRDRAIIDYNVATTGLNRQNHKTLRQLIHLADGVGGPFEGFPTGAYREVSYPLGKPFVTSVVWYDDNTKVKKIVENTVVRNSINMPVTITWKAYDVDGSTILSTVSDSIVYTSNIFEVSRTRTIT